jgi:hypothetical protein
MREDEEEEDIKRREGRKRAGKTYDRASKYSERGDRYRAIETRNPTKKKANRQRNGRRQIVSMSGNTSYQRV